MIERNKDGYRQGNENRLVATTTYLYKDSLNCLLNASVIALDGADAAKLTQNIERIVLLRDYFIEKDFAREQFREQYGRELNLNLLFDGEEVIKERMGNEYLEDIKRRAIKELAFFN